MLRVKGGQRQQNKVKNCMQFGFWFGQQIFFGQTGARGFKQKKEEDKRIKKLPIIGEDEIDVKCRPCFFGCLLQSLSE